MMMRQTNDHCLAPMCRLRMWMIAFAAAGQLIRGNPDNIVNNDVDKTVDEFLYSNVMAKPETP